MQIEMKNASTPTLPRCRGRGSRLGLSLLFAKRRSLASPLPRSGRGLWVAALLLTWIPPAPA